MTQQPRKAPWLGLLLACVTILLATLACLVLAVLARSWAAYWAALGVGGAAVTWPWCALVDKVAGKATKRETI